MLFRFYCAITLALFGSLADASVVAGLPLMQRYTPHDHHAGASNFAVVAGKDGYIFIGNERGLLRFDGGYWDLLELPGRGNARVVAFDKKNRLYVGSYDRFGRVETDSTGEMRFVDLTDTLPQSPGDSPIGQVWSICATQEGVYVYTDTVLTLLRYDDTRQHWPITPDTRGPFCTKSAVYARVQGKGLSRLESLGFRLVKGGAEFADKPLYHVFDQIDGALAVGELGFYRIDDEGLRLLSDTDGNRLADYPPYAGVMLSDGSFVFGTYSGEVVQFSADLRLSSVKTVSTSTIYELSPDAEGGLWAATDSGLLRMSFPSAWSVYAAPTGLQGQAYDTASYRGQLYVATSLGVLSARAQDGSAILAPAVTTTLEAVALTADDAGLLIADRAGVLLLQDPTQAPSRLVSSNSPITLLRSRVVPSRVYAPAVGVLDLIEQQNGRWQHVASVELGKHSLAGIAEDANGALWLGDSRGGPLRLLLDERGNELERQTYGAADGLVLADDFGSYVLTLAGEIYVISDNRVHRFRQGRFELINEAPFNQFDDPSRLELAETDVGDFAYDSSKLLQRQNKGEPWRPMLSGTALTGGYTNVHLDADGKVRLSSWDGLLQFDPQQKEIAQPPLAVRMRSILLRTGSDTNERQTLEAAGPHEFLAGALLQFDFGMPTTEPNPQYRLRIHGMFDEFSTWGPVVTPALNLRAPGAGEYTIEVEGRTPSGRVATPLRYSFTVVPTWWQEPWAKLLALLIALAALVGITKLALRWRDRRYMAVNRMLEARIAERTTELELANRKLAELATEDELTGIANRRALEQALVREWDRCASLNQSLAVVIFDVDHFKQFNDRHGHLAGDQHLVRIAQVLKRHTLPVRELLARFGGEEFVFVLPGLTLGAAFERAEHARIDIAASLPGTTISAGVAAATPTVDGDGATAILQRADMALYRAKKSGRNRVKSDE